MTLKTYDFFTDKEAEYYTKMVEQSNMLNSLDRTAKKENRVATKEEKAPFVQIKRSYQRLLNQEIAKHAGTPRVVNLNSVINTKRFKDHDGHVKLPPGITWKTLKNSRRIAEFASEQSRAMGLGHLDITLDKIIVKWKSPEILHQIIVDGFILPILHENGTVEQRMFQFNTASAGQLRTDKCQFVSCSMWEKIKDRMQCGLTWERINERGGVNVGKFNAYSSLPSSATDEWDIDLDRVIVIKDFESGVTGMMDYITQEYKIERGIRTVEINQCDGIGMALPGVLRSVCDSDNTMFRGPYFKGLLTTFDFMKFCEVYGVKPVLTDLWGQEHDLIAENIRVIMTKSQFKMWKYYDSWQEYKDIYKSCGCRFGVTNYEEPFIKDTTINYQMLQTLVDFTEEELLAFTQRTFDRISAVGTNMESMLETLHADKNSPHPYQRALAVYPELLRDGYSRNTLKDVRKRMLMDAKSGTIYCANKRLFVVPDMYAACQFWFLNDETPKGLLEDGYVFSRLYPNEDEADILRSPHLSFEHAIRKFDHSPALSEWFTTKAIYVSVHDLISRILQFDVDGDMLNVVTDPSVLSAAKRNLKDMDIVPLFYDASFAPPEILSREMMFTSLKRAHDSSGIGQISNALTKLWNKPDPDKDAAKLLTMYNNYVIDSAKTGFVNSYEDHPESKQKVNKAIGGKTGRMPYFFQFSKNGRHGTPDRHRCKPKRNYLKPNNSTMNRIAKRFESIGNINLKYAGVCPFNVNMLLSGNIDIVNTAAIELFCDMDNSNMANVIESSFENDDGNREMMKSYDILAEAIVTEINEKFGSLESVYDSIAMWLFTGENLKKATHKQMFWRVFGEIAYTNLENNLASHVECPSCKTKLTSWETGHTCSVIPAGFYRCKDCGTICVRENPKQCRCTACQKKYKKEYIASYMRERRKKVS